MVHLTNWWLINNWQQPCSCLHMCVTVGRILLWNYGCRVLLLASFFLAPESNWGDWNRHCWNGDAARDSPLCDLSVVWQNGCTQTLFVHIAGLTKALDLMTKRLARARSILSTCFHLARMMQSNDRDAVLQLWSPFNVSLWSSLSHTRLLFPPDFNCFVSKGKHHRLLLSVWHRIGGDLATSVLLSPSPIHIGDKALWLSFATIDCMIVVLLDCCLTIVIGLKWVAASSNCGLRSFKTFHKDANNSTAHRFDMLSRTDDNGEACMTMPFHLTSLQFNSWMTVWPCTSLMCCYEVHCACCWSKSCWCC